MVVPARGRVRLLADQWSLDLARRRVARRIERIRSRESARDRNSAVTVTCCCTGFRPSALVHLRSDITAQDSNL